MQPIEELTNLISSNKVEFFDFGCSHGKSIAYCKKHFARYGNGLGIDINPAKVESARANGFDAFCVDILELPADKFVRFISMIHFLEHLDSFTAARKILRKAAQLADEFILIRQPYFDADGALMKEGLKCYWSDWGGHRYCMSTLDLYRICRDMQAEGLIIGFDIGLHNRVDSSVRTEILPLSAPTNQHGYDSTVHESKPDISFEFDVYREVRALLHVKAPESDVRTRQFSWDRDIYSSVGGLSTLR